MSNDRTRRNPIASRPRSGWREAAWLACVIALIGPPGRALAEPEADPPRVEKAPQPHGPSNLVLELSKKRLHKGDDIGLGGKFTISESQGGATVEVDWGDGSPTEPDTTTLSLEPNQTSFKCEPHTYSKPGDYRIRVKVTVGSKSTKASAKAKVSPIPPDVSIYTSMPDASESTQEIGEFTVSRDGDLTRPLTVRYQIDPASTAKSGVDYCKLSGMVLIPAGSATATIDVVPLDAEKVGGKTIVKLKLSSSPLYKINPDYASPMVTIEDDDLPTIKMIATAPMASVRKRTSGAIKITRNGPTDCSLLVPYSIRGTAANGDDYEMLCGNVFIKPGNSSVLIPIVPIDTGKIGGFTTVQLALSAVDEYNVDRHSSSATVSIRNDSLPRVSIRTGQPFALQTSGSAQNIRVQGSWEASAIVLERDRDPFGPVVKRDKDPFGPADSSPPPPLQAVRCPGHFVISRTGPAGKSLTVSYSISGGTSAVKGLNGAVTIPAGRDSVAVDVAPSSDTSELNRSGYTSIVASLQDGLGRYSLISSGSAARVFITNGKEATACCYASVDAALESDPDHPAKFTIELSKPVSHQVTLSYKLGGTAKAGVDYRLIHNGSPKASQVVFPRYARRETIEVVPIANSQMPGDKTVELTLVRGDNASRDAGGVIVDSSSAIVATHDDLPKLTADNSCGVEGDIATFTVTLSRRSSKDVTVSYATVDGSAIAGRNYEPRQGKLTIRAGETQGTISVRTFLDSTKRDDTHFSLKLSDPQNAEIE